MALFDPYLGDNSLCLDIDRCDEFVREGEALDLDALTASLEADVNPHHVIIDCTASNEVSEYYERWLGAGINVISPSKVASSGPKERYDKIWSAVRDSGAVWQYESSVGSALPVISTLRDLLQTGDSVNRIEGSATGTLSYALRTFATDAVPFSEAVRQAVVQGYSEPDVRDDLSGGDMTRKVVILARELGLDVDLADVQVESLIPDHIVDKAYPGTPKEVNAAVLVDVAEALDEPMAKRLEAALDKDMVLRYRFVIDREAGTARVFLDETSKDSPLYRLKADENLVAFHTARYRNSPLIVKGSAAGPDLAASGCFADLLRLARAYRAN